MLTLTISTPDVEEPVEARTVEVTQDKVLLGRAGHCDIALPGRHLGASSEHARIEKLGTLYYVFDQGSTNGTSLNGTRIRPHTSVPLANNDKVYVGRWLIKCRIRMPTARHWTRGLAEHPQARAILSRLRQAEGEDPRSVLHEALEAVEPHERSNVLRQVEARSEDKAVQEAVAQEIENREAVREACVQSLAALSSHHTGVDRFKTADEVHRFFRLVDQAVDMMLEWIVGCISSRRAFEDQFSAKVTRFFGTGMNPVKHALTPQQVGRYLLSWEDERDAEGIKTNLEEALRDLTAHQLALVAGVQQSLKTALKQLDPEELETTVGGFFKRGKAWDRFKEIYGELLTNDSKLYNEVIYPSLRQGYLEAHERQLGSSVEDARPEEDQDDMSTLLIRPDTPS